MSEKDDVSGEVLQASERSQGADVNIKMNQEKEEIGDRLSEEEVKEINLRAMESTGDTESDGKDFLIPKKRRLDLYFFRRVFKYMLREIDTPLGKGEDSTEENLPVAAFQRTLERLFFVMRDPKGFDASEYDIDGNGCVGWSEFVRVFREREMFITLSLPERIFLTMSNPETSHSAFIISTLVLAVIATSSFCFILSTMPDFQDMNGDEEPKAKPVFQTIEHFCLGIFVIEYLLRLVTCWSVRMEVFDTEKLFKMTVSYDTIRLPSPLRRVIVFVFNPANFIDLAAILPGVLGVLFPNLPIQGGGFVVLRLIRLTRVFRAPAIREPAKIIALTIRRSTKALYVLAFNLGLGIVIFGSLMYLFESGDWDSETKTYQRRIGQEWNDTKGDYDDVKDATVFQSIPHSFWWAIVTATTVGYGDQYPTTGPGYVVAVATMMFSLVIAALPVGVIGGNFSTVWDETEEQKKLDRAEKREESSIIKVSNQRFLAFDTMSKLMVIDVWNERFPPENLKEAWNERKKPLKGDFMGCARFELNLSSSRRISEEKTLELRADYDMVPRKVSGKITVRYDWTPEDPPSVDPATDLSHLLSGTLKLTIVSAQNLINLNLGRPNVFSNPYCIVLCYPKSAWQPTANAANKSSPVCEGFVRPCIWRAPPVINNLNPEWNCDHTFLFSWYAAKGGLDTKKPKQGWEAQTEALVPPLPGVQESPGHGRQRSVARVTPVDEEAIPPSQPQAPGQRVMVSPRETSGEVS